MEYIEVKFEVFIPSEFIAELREELTKVGACKIGNYDNCISVSGVTGYWRSLEGSNPYNGEIGKISKGEEAKVEFKCSREYIKEAIRVIKSVHPYEEPVYYIIPLVNHIYEN